MNKLEEIYEKYDTDKGNKPAFPNLNRFGHEYGYFYQSFFEKYIDKNPNILEIGVFEGESILAHNEFFNKKCFITGIDAGSYLKFDINKYDNMKFVLGPSESEETFNQVKNEKYDIIIDDCSHTCKNQIQNLKIYKNLLNTNGIYIIEDLQCNLNSYYTENDMYNTTLNFLLTKRYINILTLDEYYELVNSIKYVLFYSKTREVNHMFDEERCSISAVLIFNE